MFLSCYSNITLDFGSLCSSYKDQMLVYKNPQKKTQIKHIIKQWYIHKEKLWKWRCEEITSVIQMFISRRHMSSYLIWALLCLFCGFLAREDYQIIWLSNLMTLSIPDEGYSNLMTLSINLMKVIPILWLWVLTWWRLFQSYDFEYKPDEGYSNLLTMSVPDEGYSNLLTMSVPDEGYSNLMTLSIPDEGYSNLMTLSINLMKVIPETYHTY